MILPGLSVADILTRGEFAAAAEKLKARAAEPAGPFPAGGFLFFQVDNRVFLYYNNFTHSISC